MAISHRLTKTFPVLTCDCGETFASFEMWAKHIREYVSLITNDLGRDIDKQFFGSASSASDPTLINHPPHYTQGSIEVILAIEDWKLPYHLGNVVKYVARAPYKGEELQDLRKALWYLNRYVKLVEERTSPRQS